MLKNYLSACNHSKKVTNIWTNSYWIQQPIGSVSLQIGSSSPNSANRSPKHSRLHSASSFSFLRPRSSSQGSVTYEDKNTAIQNTKNLINATQEYESVVPTEDAKASKWVIHVSSFTNFPFFLIACYYHHRKLAGNQSIEQYYQFEPVYHVFNQHLKAGKMYNIYGLNITITYVYV